nr:hypothetical protein [Marinicella sp. W31]MDC2875848.1 hypothetical protein [Marinicella sp. W31]
MILVAKRRDIGSRDLQVRRHPHLGNGDDGFLQQRIEDIAALENLGNGGADLFTNA